MRIFVGGPGRESSPWNLKGTILSLKVPRFATLLATSSKMWIRDPNKAIKKRGAFSRRFIGGRRMSHSYFYTPFMDASCAVSVLSALLCRLQFNASVCACRAIGKDRHFLIFEHKMISSF
ncbi:uncharacterized protein LOC128891395 [Hylaeus anthracinus]|uniref:uncharacterized protein LOC128891395 n=1 Tax=Hylaeus anthracinus TaxID=313031 RepID=UPI0023BA2E10|nr:uncharacterized protein LOC128891395 [Hylaeus anthracinus]